MKTDKKPAQARPLRGHIALHTKNLAESQALTSHIWSKHKSRVIGGGKFETSISRLPMGRCWLCYVDCLSPMQVAAEGCRTKVTVYLPMSGSMEISLAKQKLSAVAGGPALIPAATPMEFRATPIQCILLEIPWSRLRNELSALGWTGVRIPPMAWEPGGADSGDITDTMRFVLEHLSREDGREKSPIFQRRLEALVVSCLAEAVTARMGEHKPARQQIGRVSPDEIKQKIDACLHSNCGTAELAAYAGLTERALQQLFLKHFNTTPTAYVQEQRLAAARRELGDPANEKTVTRVASDLEFHHLGRFATAYRRKFGESPSKTLADRGKPPVQNVKKK
ncbi:MAG: AraC family transcriptional regulator [Terrimicrobiaceae bacterium]